MLRSFRAAAVVALIGVNLASVGSARLASASPVGCAVVSGTVFVDTNRNGINDDQRGLRGVAVTAYGDNDIVVSSTKTIKGGTYSLTIPSALPVRIEFGSLPKSYALGPHGVDSGTSVAFPESPDCSANLGVVRPQKTVEPCKHDDDDGCDREREQEHEREHERSSKSTSTTAAPAPASTTSGVVNAAYLSGSTQVQFAAVKAPAELPIELGNRVWADTNGNGIQDPSESAVGGVTVSLFLNGSRTDATITNRKGEYYFSSVKPYTTYEIRLDSPSDLGLGNVIDAGVWLPTTAFASRPTIDSNAVNVGGVPTIVAAVTGAPGVSDHSFDIGLVPKARISLKAVTPVSASPQTGSHLTFDLLLINVGPGSALHPLTVAGSVPVGLSLESAASGWTCAVTGIEISCASPANVAPGGKISLVLKFLVTAKGSQPVGLSVVARSASDGVGITGNSYLYAGVAFEVSAVTFTRPETPTTAVSTVPSNISASGGPTSSTPTATNTHVKPTSTTGQTGTSKSTATKVLGTTITKDGGLAITGANAIRIALAGVVLIGFGACFVVARRRRPA